MDPLDQTDDQLHRIDRQLAALNRGSASGQFAVDPGTEVDRLVRAHMSRTGEISYTVAFDAVKSDPKNDAVIRAYAAS